MDSSLLTTIIALICLLCPGTIFALFYGLVFQRRRLASVPLDYQLAVMTREHKIVVQPALLRFFLLLLGAALLLFLFLAFSTIGRVVAIIIWLLIAAYLSFHMFKMPHIRIDPGKRVIEIRRPFAKRSIPFTDLKGVLFSSTRQFGGRFVSLHIQIVMKNDTKIDLGSLSGRNRNERRQQIQTWLKEVRVPYRVI